MSRYLFILWLLAAAVSAFVLGADHVGRSVSPRIVDALAFLKRIEMPNEPDPEVEWVRKMLDTLKPRAVIEPGPHYAESSELAGAPVRPSCSTCRSTSQDFPWRSLSRSAR